MLALLINAKIYNCWCVVKDEGVLARGVIILGAAASGVVHAVAGATPVIIGRRRSANSDKLAL